MKQKHRKILRKSSRGFTLFEIMIVVGIIIVLSGAVVFKIKGNLEMARHQRVGTDISMITTQLRNYELQNNMLPTTEQGLDALVHKPTIAPVPPRWIQLMSEIPTDPWGTPYAYKNPGTHNPDSFDIYSLGPTRKEGGDVIGNWTTP